MANREERERERTIVISVIHEFEYYHVAHFISIPLNLQTRSRCRGLFTNFKSQRKCSNVYSLRNAQSENRLLRKVFVTYVRKRYNALLNAREISSSLGQDFQTHGRVKKGAASLCKTRHCRRHCLPGDSTIEIRR